MSLVWQLEIGGVKLFTKLSSIQAQCNICMDSNGEPKKYKLSSRSPTVLVPHISNHKEYKAQYDELKKAEAKKVEEKKAQEVSIQKFMSSGKLFNYLSFIFFRHFFRRSQSHQLHLRDESAIHCR
jgi:hypothetical protein